MFKKILIANRGEIACRVIRSAHKLGIKTVAVYSEADRDARHVELADEAVPIGPAPSRESYLAMDKIIAACQQTGAEAVHPGYGFLSENEVFAKRVEEAGIVFIGPKHYSIAAMGDKIASKKLAAEAGVSTIPGVNEPIADAAAAVKVARSIGYPVMIKASAGGGGKGLRVARSDAEARESFVSCQNEARNAFGDDRVFIEKFVEEPRHIEIQVLGDAHGNVVYLWERECSIQRRHQKVIEEAPSPFLDDATRRAMGEQAVALARAVRYQSAGTVEFVVGKDKSFYFLEMNTRLQVEHPVTEMITGLDLVELMIRVAAGERLPFSQRDIRREGWAIECRINAEDPFRGFLPSTGRLVLFRPPAEQDRAVRVDTGVVEGGEISVYYDSMIAKLITYGADRGAAIARMRDALDGFVIRGVASNVPFHAALMRHPRFVAGTFTTGFIAEEYPQGFRAEDAAPGDPSRFVQIAAIVQHRRSVRRNVSSGEYVVVLGDRSEHRVNIEQRGTEFLLRGAASARVRCHWSPGEPVLAAAFDDGSTIRMQVDVVGLRYRLAHGGAQVEALVVAPRAAELLKLMPHKPPPDLSRYLLAPMPGLLTEVAVQAGQSVKAGDKLAVIEAMKMENVLKASQDGEVEELLAKPGDSLAVDQPILSFKKAT
ncbi:MAG: acetyl-CoA carboxylase biotin carboxylase subunit [Gammaproteobacteria bacterium]|nr:acetyl-CoA carboxylase biotin carboxylase subunit [Gammaproteobacteria bacterium]